MIHSFTGKGGPAARDFQYRQWDGIFTAIVLVAVDYFFSMSDPFRDRASSYRGHARLAGLQNLRQP